ncbi:LytR family transcriptional regulator [Brevibacillus invocatus]|uniref:LytR family transcriptional regulator n=1 Tax=Brevibacillus invocatus TaxID=173959 RepID=A0A3M8CK95_9BACL|nr:LCP family protein [Brevibacillus invocatus]RNB76023.1 LytR family transcriptional regulator [Brevibacillus invocatus]
MQARMEKKPAHQAPKTKQKKRGRRGKKWYFLLAISVFFCLLIVGVGLALSQMDKTLEVVTDDPYKLPDQPAVVVPYEGKKALSFVIVGVDTRKNIGMLNTDVLVVAVANPETQKLTMVSLPRDTRVEMPGYPGYHKVNEVFALGENIRRDAENKGKPVTENGMTLLKKTLEGMLGIPIEHYVQLDFEGFTAVIDNLGGIKVDVDRDLVYELPQEGVYRNLKKGLQVLNGEQALGFVRHRLDKRGDAYNSSDFDRNRRQQQVIRAVVDKVVSIDGISKLTTVLDTFGKHIRTDLSAEQIKGLALDFATISSEKMVSLDNGAVWKSPYSMWPQKNMQDVRNTLKAEMATNNLQLTANRLSDAAIVELAKFEPQTKPTVAPKKPTTTAPTKVQVPPAQPEQPPQQPQSETPQTEGAPMQPPSSDAPPSPTNEQQPFPADQPPPDIVAPPAPVVEVVDQGQGEG